MTVNSHLFFWPQIVSLPEKPSASESTSNDGNREQTATKSRFKKLSDEAMEEICQLGGPTQSSSTRKNTKWGVTMFQGTVNIILSQFTTCFNMLSPWNTIQWHLVGLTATLGVR